MSLTDEVIWKNAGGTRCKFVQLKVENEALILPSLSFIARLSREVAQMDSDQKTHKHLIRAKYVTPMLIHNPISRKWRTHLISFRCVYWLCFESQDCCLKCLFGIIAISGGPPAEWVIATFLVPNVTAINCHVWWHKSHKMVVFRKRDQKGSTWKYINLWIWTFVGEDEWCNITAMQLPCSLWSGHDQILLKCMFTRGEHRLLLLRIYCKFRLNMLNKKVHMHVCMFCAC